MMIGPTVLYMGDDAARDTAVTAYLEELYTGSAAEAEETTTTNTTSTCQLYDSRQTNIPLYQPHEVFDDVDIRFEDETGTLFDPVHATIHLSM
jgi:hypothetical protein